MVIGQWIFEILLFNQDRHNLVTIFHLYLIDYLW